MTANTDNSVYTRIDPSDWPEGWSDLQERLYFEACSHYDDHVFETAYGYVYTLALDAIIQSTERSVLDAVTPETTYHIGRRGHNGETECRMAWMADRLNDVAKKDAIRKLKNEGMTESQIQSLMQSPEDFRQQCLRVNTKPTPPSRYDNTKDVWWVRLRYSIIAEEEKVRSADSCYVEIYKDDIPVGWDAVDERAYASACADYDFHIISTRFGWIYSEAFDTPEGKWRSPGIFDFSNIPLEFRSGLDFNSPIDLVTFASHFGIPAMTLHPVEVKRRREKVWFSRQEFWAFELEILNEAVQRVEQEAIKGALVKLVEAGHNKDDLASLLQNDIDAFAQLAASVNVKPAPPTRAGLWTIWNPEEDLLLDERTRGVDTDEGASAGANEILSLLGGAQ